MHRALLTVVAMLSALSCASPPSTEGGTATVVLHGARGSVRVSVEEADSSAERRQGLTGRTSLGADEGMIFLWSDVDEGPVTAQFWMKDTLLPLSIAFWDEEGRIVGIHDMEPCTEDPCPTYGSPEPFVGALEVNMGFFDEHGVRTGDRIELIE